MIRFLLVLCRKKKSEQHPTRKQHQLTWRHHARSQSLGSCRACSGDGLDSVEGRGKARGPGTSCTREHIRKLGGGDGGEVCCEDAILLVCACVCVFVRGEWSKVARRREGFACKNRIGHRNTFIIYHTLRRAWFVTLCVQTISPEHVGSAHNFAKQQSKVSEVTRACTSTVYVTPHLQWSQRIEHHALVSILTLCIRNTNNCRENNSTCRHHVAQVN